MIASMLVSVWLLAGYFVLPTVLHDPMQRPVGTVAKARLQDKGLSLLYYTELALSSPWGHVALCTDANISKLSDVSWLLNASTAANRVSKV